MAHAPDWVNVVAVTPEGKIVLVRQFRFGSNSLWLEVPGGVMEKGEDPITAGVRELSEETGYGGGKASLIGQRPSQSRHPGQPLPLCAGEGAVPTNAMKWDHDRRYRCRPRG